eukprot:CAMPEP_0172784976 /NCGR_PEP_ID=MMETSP1074-20121228/205213_1 /TAXON_ID=2916 /ORGANISM="Ceratium fusus, Strain PA161109" /LENGTH=137 /DNA_ID=CAMNT_0013621981 /DNA_START=592 /DNA_END=1004 /DNA_ORIENTATION=-
MWHAKCSHIRRLLPPAVFEQTMNNFFKAHRAAAAWGSSSLEGFGRYAAEHWVHSHPDTEPCDLYAGSYVSLSPIDAAYTGWHMVATAANRHPLATSEILTVGMATHPYEHGSVGAVALPRMENIVQHAAYEFQQVAI